MKNTTNNNAEILNAVKFINQAEKRLDYRIIHDVEYHAEKLIEATHEVHKTAKSEGWTKEQAEMLLAYLWEKGEERVNNK